VWFKPTALPGDCFLLECAYTDGSRGYDITAMSSGKLVTHIYTGVVGGNYYCTGTTAVAVGEWHHFVDVYGAPAPSPRKMYLNGTLDATASLNVSPHSTFFQGRQRLGLRAGGVLDEIRFSKTARSESYIRAQYASMSNALLQYGGQDRMARGTLMMLR
ncbi:MAG: LamG domain-containing protein, partial [Kiritimatiellae bacterium]|nr:LamG domain-containing protein [Kiritimatiellia bacterium]